MMRQHACCEINKGDTVFRSMAAYLCETNTQVSYVEHFLLLAALAAACSCLPPPETCLLPVNCAMGAVRGSSEDNGPARLTHVDAAD
jgi:hypothetical protein